MIHNAFGLIYAGDDNRLMKDLTLSRSVAALPVGSRYRCIDFILSSLVNSGINSVGVIAAKNYHSLMDHLGSGKEWDLHRKREGLFVLPPFMTKDSTGMFLGTVGALRSALGYVRRAPKDYCILCTARTVLNIDFSGIVEAHAASGADITMLFHRGAPDTCAEMGKDLRLIMDETGRVTEMELDPYRPRSDCRCLDIMVMNKELLKYLVEEAYARGEYDFKRDVILKRCASLKIMGFEHKGFCQRIDSVENYFAANMALLEPEVRKELFDPEFPIYTKVKDEMPSRYGKGAKAKNSLIADGCVIEGQVENSVLFRGVTVEKGTVVKNSIVMQGVTLAEGVSLDHVILDKGVTITAGRTLIGYDNFPIIIRKNMTI